MTPEAKVKKSVREVLERHRCYVVMPLTAGYGKSGVPDFIGCHKGHFFGVECKANGGLATALQQSNLDQIKKAGGNAFVVSGRSVGTKQEVVDGLFELTVWLMNVEWKMLGEQDAIE